MPEEILEILLDDLRALHARADREAGARFWCSDGQRLIDQLGDLIEEADAALLRGRLLFPTQLSLVRHAP